MAYPFSKLRWLRKYPPDTKSAGKRIILGVR
jgi:hypothetical protein